MKLTREEAWAIQEVYKWHDVDNTRDTILMVLDAIGIKYEVAGNVMSIKILGESIQKETEQSAYDNYKWEDEK
jgi:hypothetical protein